jgi:hypothetical protein
MYRAYFGPSGFDKPPAAEKDRWRFREFSRLSDALAWAGQVSGHGTAVAFIEGDDGTYLMKSEIATSFDHFRP